MVIRPFLLEQGVHLLSGVLSLVPLTLATGPADVSVTLAQTIWLSIASFLAVSLLARRRAAASIPEETG